MKLEFGYDFRGKTYSANTLHQYASVNEDETIIKLTYDQVGNPEKMATGI